VEPIIDLQQICLVHEKDSHAHRTRRMQKLTLACLVAQSSALALQPGHGRRVATARSAAVVRNAAALMSDDATRDPHDPANWADPEVLARLRRPIRQFDGGWADTAGRYGGKKNTNVNGEIIEATTHYGTGGGKRLEQGLGSLGASHHEGPTLPAERQEQLVLPAESFKVTKMEMSQTDEDFEMECDLGKGETEAEMFIDIEPMFLTKEEYFYGFTAESSDKIRIDHSMSSDIEGEMNAKDHNAARGAATLGSLERGADSRRIMIKLKFEPGYEAGEFESYLCFIFPNEKAFSKFYKITAKCTS
jgi:hypothetical protein